MLPLALASLLVLAAQSPAAPAPFRVGLCARTDARTDPAASELDVGFLRGAELALEIRNRRGGVFGHPLELVRLGAPDEARKALASSAADLAAVLCPDADSRVPLRAAAAKRGLALLAPVVTPAREAEALASGLVSTLRCARIGWLTDTSEDPSELRAAFERDLTAPATLAFVASLAPPPKSLAARLAGVSLDVLVLEGTPDEVEALLGGLLAGPGLPLVLTSRAAGARTPPGREVLLVHGLSPATSEPRGEFLGEFRARHGEPGLGASEGFELVQLLATAIERAGTAEPGAVRTSLASTTLDGPRGALAADEAGSVPVPPALWRRLARAEPHLPPALAAGATIPDGEGRTPDARLGPPFGALRTASFACEAGVRAVRVHFGEGAERTIEADLARLGLTTAGAAPLVDHLVREELLARTLSIVSEKYLRGTDGRAVPGQSLRVAFGAWPARDGKAWEARIAGADPDANGRAFPAEGRVHVFSTNWLVTEVAHALEPPLGADDLAYLDGTYTYGSDYRRDRRSELVRALIQSYASSLGLTTAHEVGHLFGLEHDSGDPASLMNVDEERGLAPEDAHFTEAALARLRRSPGVVK
jgi:ABC-type branched-subunit amino acid transport system substrate-binding protein